MKIAIITSSNYGSAAHHLPQLIQSACCEISIVIVSDNHITNKKRHYQKKLKKVWEIGFLGTLNGFRMRKWYDQDVKKYTQINHLEETCQQNGISYHKVSTVNCQQTQDLIKKSGADVGISLGNGYIWKKIFNSFPLGMINIHHEELPKYQNASSIIWQIYNGSTHTGYTIHKIDSKIDTGEVLYQEQIPIIFKETLADTVSNSFASILDHSAKGLIHVIKNFQSLYDNAKPQGIGSSYTTPTFWQYIKIYRQFKNLKKNIRLGK